MAGPVIDIKGNLYAHRQAGITLPIRRRSSVGATVDISGHALFFRARGLSVPLAPNPDDATGRLLLLDPTDLAKLPLGNSAYAIVDTAHPDYPPLLDGVITVRGW